LKHSETYAGKGKNSTSTTSGNLTQLPNTFPMAKPYRYG